MSDIRYAQGAGGKLAYRIVGEGEPVIMLLNLWFSNLDLMAQFPSLWNAVEAFSSLGRLIVWDRRGAGLSDRSSAPVFGDEAVDDLIAVLDDAGIQRCSVFGFNESTMLAVQSAHAHPERVEKLVLYGGYATTVLKDDYPWAPTPEDRAGEVDFLVNFWGTRESAQIMMAGGEEDAIEWGMKWMRNSITRDRLPEIYERLGEIDVRHLLPEISVPTLVLNRSGDLNVPPDNSRYIASKIPGAKHIEFAGEQHVPFLGDWATIEGEVEEFITGRRHQRGHERVLATIVFTDIVSSTEKAVELGDARWRKLLDDYDSIVRRETERAGGRVVKFTGDGSLASFQSPGAAISSAESIREHVKKVGLAIRAGIHTGEVEVRGDDVGGIAVHIGARVMAAAEPGSVLVSPSVPPLVAGSGTSFDPKGPHSLKGVEGEWDLFEVI